MEAEGLGRLATEREPVALKGITMIQSIAKKCAWDVKRLTQAEGFIAVAIAWNGTWEIETRGATADEARSRLARQLELIDVLAADAA